MFKTIVVGCDGTEHGRGAVGLAHALAQATGARLILVGVHHDPPLPYPTSYAQIHRELDRALRAVRDELAPEAIIRRAAGLLPGHVLCDVAESEHADLIVVGSRPRGKVARMLEGDHAREVLHHTRSAVAVAPDALPIHRRLRRIGVGVDDTPESAMAVVIGRELARLTGAELRLIAVASDAAPGWIAYERAPDDDDAYERVMDERWGLARELIHTRLDSCPDVVARGDAIAGDPAGELIRASADLDLLVLGSRRLGPVRRVLSGSTSERVIRNAACPVLVPWRVRAEKKAADPATAMAMP